MNDIITESSQVPHTNGRLRVDTSKGQILLLVPPGQPGDRLVIYKTSADNHMISVLADSKIFLFGQGEGSAHLELNNQGGMWTTQW